MTVLQLRLNTQYYLKDPQSSELGAKIIDSSIRLIDVIGFESFTFRKLSAEINSTEASIYRYFENKHRLLIYIMSWYWAWLEYRIEFATNNLESPEEKLETALKLITERKVKDESFPDIDEEALQRIVIAESDKSYLTKQVDQDNKDGLFKGYKSLCHKVSLFITELNPQYEFPHSLVSTAIEAANQQVFFAKHLPSLTEIKKDGDVFDQSFTFIKSLVFNSIKA